MLIDGKSVPCYEFFYLRGLVSASFHRVPNRSESLEALGTWCRRRNLQGFSRENHQKLGVNQKKLRDFHYGSLIKR